MKKIVYIVVVLVVVLAGYIGVDAIFTKSYDIPTTFAHQGEFIIALNENGTVDATRAVTLSAPRIRGLQITWLAPEGTMVETGDPVIKFDASEQIADLADNQSTLKINTSALERAKNEYTIQEKQLKLDLEKARRNYDEQKHEAPRVAEESRMELELAELNFEAKLEQLTADVDKAEVEVDRAQDKVNLAQRELSQMTITATIPGLVVYLEIWKGGSMEKVQEGDSPWPGMGLINLPDLGEMMVKTTVSEVDANKVDTSQEVVVVLDAYPDVEFPGRVSSISTLARRKESGSKINVFDVEVTINNHDDRLKPGMSAASRIIVERLQDVVSVPLEAVFEKDGQTVVFFKGGKQTAVVVGQRNDRHIEVIKGLDGDEEICLVDPTLEEQGLPGDKATEPELNKGRTQTPQKQPGKRPSGRKRGK
ncbi:MAG: efflux RND transporter periplasmic adaptor subunit [candidate division Zixibacteria bacterium]|nr:efflux RND transporter periplasmic adaptor subunit [candidate division Zixibacteria bacterium]